MPGRRAALEQPRGRAAHGRSAGLVASRCGRRIERHVRLKTFAAAFALVERAAALAEAQGHHPDICFGWGFATFSLSTKAIGGLHLNDFVLAAKLDALIDPRPLNAP